MPVGTCVMRTADSVRFTCCPPAPEARNVSIMMKVLRAKLFQRRAEEQEAEKQKIRGARTEAAWGNQIRSYVLHPYRLVKDHRTGCETSDTESVMGGDIAAFIDAYLHWRAQRT